MGESASAYWGRVDVAVITIRDDEYEAVLRRLSPPQVVKGRRTYLVGTVQVGDPRVRDATVVVVRSYPQGNGPAQAAAHDLIEDFHPNLLAVVGIGGAVPSSDTSLGDVVVAGRLADLRVLALVPDRLPQLELRGERIDRNLLDMLVSLRMSEPAGWTENLDMDQPPVRLDADRFEGSDEHAAKLKEHLQARFGEDPAPAAPRWSLATIASSDSLVRDPAVVKRWLESSRKIASIEMEAAGVFEAATSTHAAYPVLVVRGTSDVIGYRREGDWTTYACQTAAAFLIALIKSGRLETIRPMSVPILMQEAGNFPTFLEVVIKHLDEARRGTIFIACDYAGYAMFSDGAIFDRYLAALEQASKRCTIKMTFDATSDLRNELQDVTGAEAARDDAAFERRLDDPHFVKCLERFRARMDKEASAAVQHGLRSPGPPPPSWTRLTWMRALEAMETYYQQRLRPFVQQAITPGRMPVYMWITESKAIWALAHHDPGERLHVDVHTIGAATIEGELPWAEFAYVSDDKRFVNRLREVWRRYRKSAAPIASDSSQPPPA